MIDNNGNLVTSEEAIENLAVDVYSKRLEGNKMKENLSDLEKAGNDLCK